jgi:hypothetical protein
LVQLSLSQQGARLSANYELINILKNQFLAPVIDFLKNETIPDQQFDIDIVIGTIYTKIQNIVFKNETISPNNFEITLNEPNIIMVSMTNVTGLGYFDLDLNFWKFIRETDKVDLTINQLNLVANISLQTVESKVDVGKLLPTIKIENINLDLTFDFDIEGSFFAKLADTFKSTVKNMIKSQIQNQLKTSIAEDAKKYIDNLISNQTVYYKIPDYDFVFDYSLIDAPKVEKGSLVVYSTAEFVKLNQSNLNLNKLMAKSPHQESFINPLDDQLTLSLSSACINKSLNSLYDPQLFKFEIKSENVPANSPVQLNTTSLDVFINNLSKTYGKDKKIILDCDIMKAPSILVNDKVSISLSGECDLKVEVNETFYESAINFSFDTNLIGNVFLQPEGILSATIETLDVSNSILLKSNVPGAEIQYFEQFLDFVTYLGAPIISKKLSNINILPFLPKIEGVSINDSSLDVSNYYINFGVNPKFSQEFLDKLLEFIRAALEPYKPKNYHRTNLNKFLKFLYY